MSSAAITPSQQTTKLLNAIQRYIDVDQDNFDLTRNITSSLMNPASLGYQGPSKLQIHPGGPRLTRQVSRLLDTLESIPENVRYPSSPKTWTTVYSFPPLERSLRYSSEENIPIERVANRSRKSSLEFCRCILDSTARSRRTSQTNRFYLTGSTGVGKTTFLKYVCRTKSHLFVKRGYILSRLRFRDIDVKFTPHFYDNPDRVKEFLVKKMIAILFRDLLQTIISVEAGEIITLPESNGRKISHKTIKDIKEDIASAVDSLETIATPSLFGENYEYDSTLLTIELRAELVYRAAERGFRFIVVLDGFDAIAPEDIILFRDNAYFPNDNRHRSTLFFESLRLLHGNLFVGDGHRLEAVVKFAVSTYIFALRPTTVSQMKRHLQGSTDFNSTTYDANSWFVVGTDVFDVVRNRVEGLRTLPTKTNIRELDVGQFQKFIELSLKSIVLALSRAHEGHIEEDRFITLFNHDIRDKLKFVVRACKYAVRELAYYLLETRVNAPKPGEDSSARRTSEDETPLIGIDLLLDALKVIKFEVFDLHTLLILGTDETFVNYFQRNADGKWDEGSERGFFDNVFNYMRRDASVDGTDPYKYNNTRDPLLC